MYRALLPSLYLPSFLMSVCQGSVLLVIPLFALELGGSAGLAALVFALRGLGNMTVDVPAGYAASRLGDKVTMLLGIGVMAITGFGASQANSPTMLAVAAFLLGAAMATWLLARLTHIGEVVPTHNRGKAISTMAGIQRFGNMLGPIASGVIAVQFGYEYVFIAVGIIASFTFVLVIFFVPDNMKGAHEDSPGIVALVPHILSTHRRAFLTAGLAMLLLTVLRAGRQLMIPLWGESIGLDPSEIGLVVGIAAGVDMLMFPIAGYVMDNHGRRYVAFSCLAILTLGLSLVPFSTTFLTLTLAATLAGLGNGLGSGINMTLGTDFAPAHERGEFLGVWRLMGDSGSFAGPMLVGFVASSAALSSAFVFTGVLGVVAIGIILTAVPETLTRRQ